MVMGKGGDFSGPLGLWPPSLVLVLSRYLWLQRANSQPQRCPVVSCGVTVSSSSNGTVPCVSPGPQSVDNCAPCYPAWRSFMQDTTVITVFITLYLDNVCHKFVAVFQAML